MEFSIESVSESNGMSEKLRPVLGYMFDISASSFPLPVGLFHLKEVKIEVSWKLYCFVLLSPVLWQLFHHHKRLNFKSLQRQKLPKCRAMIFISLSSFINIFVELL